MKSNSIVLSFYAAIAMLIGLVTLGCELQHADGTTGSDDEKTDVAEQDPTETENAGFFKQAKNLIGQAKELSQETASDAGEWVNGAVGDVVGDVVGNAKDAAGDSSQWVIETYNTLHEQGLTTAKNAHQWVQEDYRSMYSFEYKILSKSEVSPEEMEATLNELGKERWDCFEVDSAAFYFKRQKKSYLRNVPVKDLMRFLPMGGDGGE